MLPIELTTTDGNIDLSQSLPVQNVTTGDGKPMGKLRANLGPNGIAVLKFADIFANTDTPLNLSQTNGVSLRTWRPFWWPESIMAQPK